MLYPYKSTTHIYIVYLYTHTAYKRKDCAPELKLNSSIKSMTNDGIENQHNDNTFNRTMYNRRTPMARECKEKKTWQSGRQEETVQIKHINQLMCVLCCAVNACNEMEM